MPKTLTYDPAGMTLTVTTGPLSLSATPPEAGQSLLLTVTVTSIYGKWTGTLQIPSNVAGADTLDEWIKSALESLCVELQQCWQNIADLQSRGY